MQVGAKLNKFSATSILLFRFDKILKTYFDYLGNIFRRFRIDRVSLILFASARIARIQPIFSTFAQQYRIVMEKYFKIISIAIVALFAINRTDAQIRLGAKLGANLARVTDTEKTDRYGYQFGDQLGLACEYFFDNYFAVQPELTYVHVGESVRALNIVQLPVNFKAVLFDNDVINVYATAGPFARFIDPSIFDFGAGAGLGLEYNNFTLDFGFQQGFGNINNRSNEENKSTMKLHVFMVSVGKYLKR